jgi:hypothetical protein
MRGLSSHRSWPYSDLIKTYRDQKDTLLARPPPRNFLHLSRSKSVCLYDGESVNRSQIDVERKICDIRTWKKYLLLDISSTNIDILVLSLYDCVKTRSVEVFCLLSQPLPQLRFNLFVIIETFSTEVVFSGSDRWKSLGAKSGL